MADIIQNLESNDPRVVEETKRNLHEMFNNVKEPWLITGLYDSYLVTNSTRLIHILVNVKEPHYLFLFDKIDDSIKGSRINNKIQGLTLLGHIVSNQPTWIYKINQHPIMKDLLKLLKTEPDILLLLSGLMPLIVLIPLVPTLMDTFQRDVFDIFCHLASLNFTSSSKYMEEQMVHLQVALYALFLRLYGMYPCNFLAYLRDQYRNKNLTPIFTHTIQPMLDTVKMHPNLVTTSKHTETSKERWVKMGAEDIIVECERFSLEFPNRCSHETCFMSSFRSRSGTTTSNTTQVSESPNQLQNLKQTNAIVGDNTFFSPSLILHCQTPPVAEISMSTPIPFTQNIQTTVITSVSHVSQESSSPPEAAIEATPETTPIRDNRIIHRIPHNTSSIKSYTFGAKKPLNSGCSTPINSQPSSPMRKETAPFTFDRQHSAFSAKTELNHGAARLQRLLQDRQQQLMSEANEMRRLPPTSPVKIPTETSYDTAQRLESPFSQEDEEVSQIVREGDADGNRTLRHCDSVVHEAEYGGDEEEEANNCEQEHGSPCVVGGLHMPDSKSINDFTKRIQRLRYSSQCADDNEKCELSTGSSPGNAVSYPNNQVRRTNSCPEMKKSPVVPTKDNINSRTLVETDEDGNGDAQPVSNGFDPSSDAAGKQQQQSMTKVEKMKNLKASETQTENFFPMPYEHLFLNIFPSLNSNEAKASPGSIITRPERPSSCNTYDITDRYTDMCGRGEKEATIECLKNQIELLKLQLHFEKHRREMHAFKNRRLLADARNTRALDEHNAALKDQVQIKQADIETLTKEMNRIKHECHGNEKDAQQCSGIWERKYNELHHDYVELNERHEELEKVLVSTKQQLAAIDAKWQSAEAEHLNALMEVKIAKEQAEAGERGRVELECLNRELVLIGELQLKYQEKLNDVNLLRRSDVELKKITETYKHEIHSIRGELERKRELLDIYKGRISELEQLALQHEESTNMHKKQLNEIKNTYNTKIEAVESKYQNQLAVNRSLEDKIVELWSQIEMHTKKVISPDTSSCHEVNASLTDQTNTAQGLSPQTSPLSVSLASSDGGSAAMMAEPKEMKNLHKIVDQKDENNE